MRAVLDHGPVARSNLARLTGTSAASITGVSAALLERGLLRELPEAAGRPGFGRPHVPLDLETGRVAVVGIHVAVPRTTVALLDLRGRVLESRTLPHHRPSPGAVVARSAKEVAELVEEHAERRILGLGVATGGWVDAGQGVVVDHPVLAWRDVPLRELMARATGLPTYLENHGRALLRAEQLVGAHATRARASIVHLFVGHVVDAAFAVHGRVHQGPRSAAGNLAHLPVDADPATTDSCTCGRVGCLQAAVSATGLVRRAADLGLDAASAGVLAELARGGDERAGRLFVERARVLGHAVASLLDLLDPDVLTVVEPGFLWVPRAREALLAEIAERSEVVRDPADVVVPSSFAEPLSVAGGAVLLDLIHRSPLSTVPPSPARSVTRT